MGSTSPTLSSLPPADSASLILTNPTPAERQAVWATTHTMWGNALSLDGYLRREAYLMTVPMAKNGGITHWILTVADQPPDARPVLSSCETLRKQAVSASGSATGDVVVVDGIAHGIASVFTDPRYRGRGYASRMMRELGPRLRGWQAGSEPDSHSLFSVLYSDIGKAFYATHGWAPMPSTHASFPPAAAAASSGVSGSGSGSEAKPIGYHELAELCAVDERLLRASLAQRAAATANQEGSKGSTTCIALLPELDAMLWHMMREDYMTKHIFGRTPTVRGAVFGEPGRRVWAVWTRSYYGGLERMEGNTLHVLRVVVEDESGFSSSGGGGEGEVSDYLVDGFRAVVRIAQAEAAEWRSQDVQTWNPTPLTRKLVERCGLQHEYVDRDKDSIASLMWYGDEPSADIDWVANEKFGWC